MTHDIYDRLSDNWETLQYYKIFQFENNYLFSVIHNYFYNFTTV